MKEPTRGAAGELVSLAWQRIQLVVRLRPSHSAELDPRAMRLEFASNPAIRMAPTHATAEDADVVLRFNVMQGPGQMPLETGSWHLTLHAARGAGRHLSWRRGEGLDLQRAAARFETERGEYYVRPAIDETDGSLVLDVALDPSVRPRRGRRPVISHSRRFLRSVRMRIFQLVSFAFQRVSRRNGRRIFFMPHYGNAISGDMQAVLERMTERGLDRAYEIQAIPPRRGRSLKDWLRLPWLLARADTIVLDEDAFDIQRSDARIIQLWHASGALKLIGYSRIGKPGVGERGGELGAWGRKYKQTTYAIVAGEHDVPLFAEAFGIPEERVIPSGHPRMDRFFDAAYQARAREATLEAFPTARGRMLILFAPTWRMSDSGRGNDLSVLDFEQLHKLCVAKNAVFIIRLHPTVEHPVDIPERYSDRLLNGSTGLMEAPDVLCATDLLITDYSSIILEYSLFRRPMLFFAYDLEDYVASRDLYMPYEEFVPGRIVRTFDELVDAIRRDDYDADKVDAFARRHFSHFDSGATDRVIELILGRPAN